MAREFNSYPEAEAWLWRAFSAWADHLTAAERRAVALYKGSACAEINAALRGTRRMTPDLQDIVDDLDLALRRMRLPESIVVYRGVAPDGTLTAGEIVDRAVNRPTYVSTSLSLVVAETFARAAGGGGVVAKITLPGGPAGVWAAAPDLVRDMGELEILLPPTRLRHLVDDAKSHSKKSVINLEVLT